MHLVQILLPLYDNEGNRFAAEEFSALRQELADRFGGVTVYSRAPADGLWKEAPGVARHDDVILFEVMVEELDRPWWNACRRRLEVHFRQEAIVVRAQEIQML